MNNQFDINEARNQIWFCYHLLENIIENIDDLETIETLNKAIPGLIPKSLKKARELRRAKQNSVDSS